MLIGSKTHATFYGVEAITQCWGKLYCVKKIKEALKSSLRIFPILQAQPKTSIVIFHFHVCTTKNIFHYFPSSHIPYRSIIRKTLNMNCSITKTFVLLEQST